MYCQNCGTELEDTATFCSNCGNKVARSRMSLSDRIMSNPFDWLRTPSHALRKVSSSLDAMPGLRVVAAKGEYRGTEARLRRRMDKWA